MVGNTIKTLSTCHCCRIFDAEHAMSCRKADLSIYVRHDTVRDLFASLVKDVFLDTGVEPNLQILTGGDFNRISPGHFWSSWP